MLKVTVWTLRCQTWRANIAHCLNDVQTLAETRNEKKNSKYSDDFIVKTLPAIRALLRHSKEGYHTPRYTKQNSKQKTLGHKHRRWRPLLHSQKAYYHRATVVHTNTIHIPDLWFTRNQLLNIQKEETKNRAFAVTQTNTFYLSIHNIFRPSQAIIMKRFLAKYTNGDGTHVNHRASAKRFVGCTRSDPTQYCVCIGLHCVFF
jgi:hypothetical protein